MKTQKLLKLIEKLNLNHNSLDETTWLELKSKLPELIEHHFNENDFLEKNIELGYQEIENVLELIEQRDLLSRSIFDASMDMILTLDQYGQVIDFNRATEKILKISRKSSLGKKFISLLPKSDFLNDLEMIVTNFDSNSSENILGESHESILCASDGIELPVLVSMNRIQLRNSIIYPLYIKDLSSEKAASLALEQSRAQMILASKMSALGEMAGGIAHEINTPLAVIQMRTDQLLEHVEDGTLTNATLINSLQAIENTVKRIAQIISGLRSFARDGSRDPMIVFRVSKIVEDTFSLCKEKFKSHGISLEFDLKQDADIECRPGEISQVILNLLNNSFDAIQELPEKWIKIELNKIANLIFIRVTDSGKGITPENQKKLMQPFFTTKEIGKGTGLGLSISRGLIRSHHGKLDFDSQSENTSFLIALPLRQNKN
jgi:PAS domain S-box-containing protein